MNPSAFTHGLAAHLPLGHPEWMSGVAWIVVVTTACIVLAKLLARVRVLRMLGNRSRSATPTLSSDAALVVALTAICVALLGPELGERTITIPDGGVDVVFLIDVSRSMDAIDVPPTRLDRARRAAEELIGRLGPGDRVALAIFAERGLVLTPLTPDRNALLDLLADIDTGFMEPASSNIASGIHAALTAFEGGSSRPRVIVVASDGEDSRRSGDLGAAAAARAKVRVVTLALGTDLGGYIPDAGRVLRDREGNSVLTKRDTERLAQLADATGGQALRGDEWGRFDFDVAADAVGRDASTVAGPIDRRVPAARALPFAALAFAILLFEGLPRNGFRRNRRIAWGIAAAMAPLIAEGLFPASPASGDDPASIPSPGTVQRLEQTVRDSKQDARALIDLGVAYLAIGRHSEADQAFLSATLHARDTEVASTAYFDLGVAALEQNHLTRARDAFFDALALDPSDDSARFNFEWTLAALRADSREANVPQTVPDASAPKATRVSPDPDPSNNASTSSRIQDAPDGAGALRLSAARRQQWLDRISEDSRPWLRATADDSRDPKDRGRTSAW